MTVILETFLGIIIGFTIIFLAPLVILGALAIIESFIKEVLLW